MDTRQGEAWCRLEGLDATLVTHTTGWPTDRLFGMAKEIPHKNSDFCLLLKSQTLALG